MEYTLRKQQRDIDSVAEDVRRHRLTLVDMAGDEAVDKLDKQLVEEQNKVAQGTEIPTVTDSPAGNAEAKAEGNVPASGDEQAKTAEKTDSKSEEVPIDQSTNENQEPKQQTASTNPSPQS